MNIRERIERIEALEAECYERFKALKAEVQREDEFPRDGDEYWFITDRGMVFDSKFENKKSDRDSLEIGNFFQTKEQVEFAVEKLKVEAELRKFSRPFEYGKFNYSLIFDIDGDDFRTDFTGYCPPQGAIYFESEEKAQEAVSAVGKERIKKYLFGVEDL